MWPFASTCGGRSACWSWRRRLAAALAHRAREHRATLFADHTYLQQAQPSTIGHYLTSFAYPMLRDAERLLEVVAWLEREPVWRRGRERQPPGDGPADVGGTRSASTTSS